MHRKNLILTSFLLAIAFIGYYTVRALFTQLPASFSTYESILIRGTYHVAIIISSILGAILSQRVGRMRILRLWMTLGCVASALPLLLSSESVGNLSIMMLFLGFSFGVGMPSCLAFFSESAGFERRGVSSGIAFFVTNLGAFLLTFLSNTIVTMFGVSLALWIAGLIALLPSKSISLDKPKTEKSASFKTLLQNRTFLLYAVPWLTFCLVDKFEGIYFKMFFERSFFDLMSLVELAVGTIFVLFAGLLADRVGRKRVLIYGFVALGIGYASIGLAPYIDVSRYFYMFVDGIAWGIFMVIYLLVLWGDFSSKQGVAEKYYTLGSLPFFLADFIVLFFGPYVQEMPGASAYAIFSLASFFLFLAVVPLMFAPETLPEKSIKDRELKEYISKAKKAKEKYA